MLSRWFPIQSYLTDGSICVCLRCRLAATSLTNVGILKMFHLFGGIADGRSVQAITELCRGLLSA